MIKNKKKEIIIVASFIATSFLGISIYHYLSDPFIDTKLLGLGIGLLCGFYFVLLDILEWNKRSKNYKKFIRMLFLLIFPITLLIISKYLLGGYILGFGISFSFCYAIEQNLK